MREYPSYLIHYGIQGQKWGVRRFQNEDGTYTAEGLERRNKGLKVSDKDALVLPKGTTVNRISIHKKEKLKGSKYLYTDIDKDIYEGAFSKYQKYAHGKNTKIYKKTFETKEDLIAPSNRKAQEIISDRISKNKKVASNVTNFTTSLILKGHPALKDVFEKNKIKINTDEPHAALKAYVNADKEKREKIFKDMEFISYNLMVENNKKELNNLLKEVSKQGYNSIMDYNNVKVYNEAIEPFIAINAKKTLKEINNEFIEDQITEETFARLEKKLASKGKRPVL